MIYRIKSNAILFDEWSRLEKELNFPDLHMKSLVQNDMFLSSEMLNENYKILNKIIRNLNGDELNRATINNLIKQRDETTKYIRELNNNPLETEEFGDYRKYACPHFIGQWEGEPEEQEMKYGDPVLVYCNHSKNPDKHEGNCNMMACPLLK